MKKIFSLSFLCYYAFGIFCLPVGDFSSLTDLPVMYRHCIATEDKDMTPFDFITDHLVNTDGLFDKHTKGDEQKPHNPPPVHHQQIHNFYSLTFSEEVLIKPTCQEIAGFNFQNTFYCTDFISTVFRPPIV